MRFVLRVFLVVSCLSMSTVVMAQSVTSNYVNQLAELGYSDIRISRTWLGRFKIYAERDGVTRELVVAKNGRLLFDYLDADNRTPSVSIEATKKQNDDEPSQPAAKPVTTTPVAKAPVEPAKPTPTPTPTPPTPTVPGHSDPDKPSKPRPTGPGKDDPDRPSKPRPTGPGKDDPDRPSKPRPTGPGKDDPDRPSKPRPTGPGKDDPDRPSKPRPTGPSKGEPDKPAKPRPNGPNKGNNGVGHGAGGAKD